MHGQEHEGPLDSRIMRDTEKMCLQPSSLCLLIAFQLAVHILYGFPLHVLLHHLHHVASFGMQGPHICLCSQQILPMSYAMFYLVFKDDACLFSVHILAYASAGAVHGLAVMHSKA